MKRNDIKELRAQRMKYIHVMNEVKPVPKLPKLDLVTTAMAAEYFEVDASTINSSYSFRKKELEEYGIIKLKVDDFINAGYDVSTSEEHHTVKIARCGDTTVKLTNIGVRCMSEAALFNIALSMMASPVATEIQKAVIEEENLDARNNVVANKDESENSYEEIAAAVETASDIRTFTNVEFGSVRIVVKDGEPWFVGKDVAASLGYAKPENAISNHVDLEDKTSTLIQGTGSKYKSKAVIINESGLYSLVMSSKLPSAKNFKRWVIGDVLPSIRKHGAYMTPETLTKSLQDPKSLIVLLETLKSEQEKNMQLATANKAMSKDINTWNNKSVLNALLRSYAANCFGNNFKGAFSEFYRQLNYKYHINVKARRSNSGDDNKPLIDFLKENELEDAVRLAVAICEASGINAGKVINEANMAACGT